MSEEVMGPFGMVAFPHKNYAIGGKNKWLRLWKVGSVNLSDADYFSAKKVEGHA